MKEESLVTKWCGDMSSYGMFMVICLLMEHYQGNCYVLASKRYVNQTTRAAMQQCR
jgi:hypothetical protein